MLCCAYRAPNTNFQDFISNMAKCMPNVILEKSDLVILGDLNVNIYMLANAKVCKKDRKELQRFLRVYDLRQLIKEPTRITNDSRSLIDSILVNNDHRIVKTGIVPVRLSDHYLVYSILKASVIKAQPRIL